jgi:hypothetical protein
LQALVADAQVKLATRGRIVMPAAPWFAAAEHLQHCRAACGLPAPAETAAGIIEDALQTAGLMCSWWMYDLILGLPGWVPPAPVAVQPRLFE